MIIVGILFGFVWGYCCYKLAPKKGQDQKVWAVLGFFFGLIPLIILAVMKDKDEVIYSEDYKVSGDPADELKKYKDLLDSGAITQEEYDRKKEEILERG